MLMMGAEEKKDQGDSRFGFAQLDGRWSHLLWCVCVCVCVCVYFFRKIT